MAKPLRILVDPTIFPTAFVSDLQQQGHTVIPMVNDCEGFDLILGPTCCRFLPGMEKFLPAIIKGARKVRYPAKEKR